MISYSPLRRELREMGVPLPQDDSEFEAFLNVVAEQSPRTVVEIGTRDGGSLWMLARTLPTTTLIISIDLPDGPWGRANSATNRQRVAQDLRERGYHVTLIDANSQLESTRDELKKALGKRRIDLLFIDADHTFRGSLRDWELYSPLVAKNGAIAFHDILESKRTPRVKVFCVWQVLKTMYPTQEFLSESKNRGIYGIGVLRKV